MLIALRVEYVGDINLTPDYWDCECHENYIHKKAEILCSFCRTTPDEQPDSRVNEVSELLESLGHVVTLIPGKRKNYSRQDFK